MIKRIKILEVTEVPLLSFHFFWPARMAWQRSCGCWPRNERKTLREGTSCRRHLTVNPQIDLRSTATRHYVFVGTVKYKPAAKESEIGFKSWPIYILLVQRYGPGESNFLSLDISDRQLFSFIILECRSNVQRKVDSLHLLWAHSWPCDQGSMNAGATISES